VIPYYGCQTVRPYLEYDAPDRPETMDRLLEAMGAEVLPFSRGQIGLEQEVPGQVPVHDLHARRDRLQVREDLFDEFAESPRVVGLTLLPHDLVGGLPRVEWRFHERRFLDLLEQLVEGPARGGFPLVLPTHVCPLQEQGCRVAIDDPASGERLHRARNTNAGAGGKSGENLGQPERLFLEGDRFQDDGAARKVVP